MNTQNKADRLDYDFTGLPRSVRETIRGSRSNRKSLGIWGCTPVVLENNPLTPNNLSCRFSDLTGEGELLPVMLGDIGKADEASAIGEAQHTSTWLRLLRVMVERPFYR